MRQPTAHDVVDTEIPGDLNVFFADKNITIQAAGKPDAFVLDLEDTPPVKAPAQTDITLAATIENNATTDSGGPFGGGNPDSCTTGGGDDGTALRLVVSGSVEGSVETCIEDSTVVTGPNTDTVGVSFQLPDNPSATYFVDLYIEGANSGVRVTPVYSIPLTVPDEDDGDTDFDGGDGPDEGGDGGDGGDGSLMLSDLTITCGLSAFDVGVGERINVEYSVTGAAPPGESYEVDVDLYSNGTFIDTLTEGISPNGSGGGEFEVELPTEGSYEFTVGLSNLRRV